MGKFSRKHIYGEGIMDSVKSSFGKKPTKKVKFTLLPPKPTPAISTKNARDKIVKLLSGENPSSSSSSRKTNNRQGHKMTQQEINNKVLQIMTGGKII